MKRGFAIILGILAGIMLLLALAGQLVLQLTEAEMAYADRINQELLSQFTTVDSAVPLPENEGKPVRVCGKVEIVSFESDELEDELLGVRVMGLNLLREVEDRSGENCNAVLPGGLKITRAHQCSSRTGLECSLGGFSYQDALWSDVSVYDFEWWCTPYTDTFKSIRRDEMNPAPEVLQDAEWVEDDQCWSYRNGEVTVRAICFQPVVKNDGAAVVYGMQRGDRIVPYTCRIPQSWSVSSLLKSMPSPLYLDVLVAYDAGREPLRHREALEDVPGIYERVAQLEASWRDIASMAFWGSVGLIVLATLLALALLAVMLHFCLHRRVRPCMLYVGGGMLLLTLLNYWNAHWIW